MSFNSKMITDKNFIVDEVTISKEKYMNINEIESRYKQIIEDLKDRVIISHLEGIENARDVILLWFKGDDNVEKIINKLDEEILKLKNLKGGL